MTESVRADLIIEVNIDCPECDRTIDLTDLGINDEGFIYKQLLDDERWSIDEDDRIECDISCPHCGVDIHVKGVNW